MLGVLIRHGAAVADWLWPPVCPRCGGRAERPREQHCEGCWSSLRPLRPEDSRWLLSGARGLEPDSPVAQAAFAVDGLFIELLTTAKYRRVRPVGLRLADLAAARLAHALPPGVLVPVPLTRAKRRERGFNQPEDFARVLARRSDRALRPDVLRRIRGGRALAGLEHQRRLRAVEGAFAVPASANLPEDPVVIVDDVVTTGATARACTAALRQAGVARVAVVAMARAFQPGQDSAPTFAEAFEHL